jgi:hypothetical protein
MEAQFESQSARLAWARGGIGGWSLKRQRTWMRRGPGGCGVALEDGRGDGAACATVLTDGKPILTVPTQYGIDRPGGTTRVRHGHFDESSAAWSSMEAVALRAHRGAARSTSELDVPRARKTKERDVLRRRGAADGWMSG